jgi:hypothetical protein
VDHQWGSETKQPTKPINNPRYISLSSTLNPSPSPDPPHPTAAAARAQALALDSRSLVRTQSARSPSLFPHSHGLSSQSHPSTATPHVPRRHLSASVPWPPPSRGPARPAAVVATRRHHPLPQRRAGQVGAGRRGTQPRQRRADGQTAQAAHGVEAWSGGESSCVLGDLDNPLGFGDPRVSVSGMDLHPNRFSGRIRVSSSGFGFGCLDTPPDPNPPRCHP